MPRINLSVSDADKSWMEEHDTINYSDVFRKALKELKVNDPNKKNPLFFVSCSGGIILGVVLILVSTLRFMSWEIRVFLPLLGGILSFVSAFTYYKEYGRVRKSNHD